MSDITGSQRERTDKVRLKKEKLAGFFYDLAKLVFAGTIVTSIPAITNLKDVDAFTLFFGVCGTSFMAWIANRILTY